MHWCSASSRGCSSSVHTEPRRSLMSWLTFIICPSWLNGGKSASETDIWSSDSLTQPQIRSIRSLGLSVWCSYSRTQARMWGEQKLSRFPYKMRYLAWSRPVLVLIFNNLILLIPSLWHAEGGKVTFKRKHAPSCIFKRFNWLCRGFSGSTCQCFQKCRSHLCW